MFVQTCCSAKQSFYREKIVTDAFESDELSQL